MAEGIDRDEIRRYFECGICLNTYTNPKQLACGHQYCKECLDDLVEFKRGGSAVIYCPSRCREHTIISENQTTNDLGTCYEFKGLLELLKPADQNSEDAVRLCSYTKGCQGEVSLYCCGKMMCKSCEAAHNVHRICHQWRRDVFFDKKEEELKTLCNEHNSACTHVCTRAPCTHNKCSNINFVCMYCINRTHKDHRKDTIKNEARNIREASEGNGSRVERYIGDVLQITNENIQLGKEKLDKSLRERKVACLSSYLDLLNREDEVIRKQFEYLSRDHIHRYHDTDAAKDRQKDDIEIVFESNIPRPFMRPPVSRYTMSLSDDFDFRNYHPLGELKVDIGEEIPVDNLPSIPPFLVEFKAIKDYDHIISQFSKDVETLLEGGLTGTHVGNYRSGFPQNVLTDIKNEQISPPNYSPAPYTSQRIKMM